MSIEQANCIRRFTRVCTDGWELGWHERNAGNLSYRMSDEDVSVCMPYISIKGEGHEWQPLGVAVPEMAGEFFIVTGAGKYLRKVSLDLADSIGIVELNAEGDAYRKLWGLSNGGRPTSEFAAHVLCHAARVQATEGANRLIYHAHCPSVTALSTIIAPDARHLSRILWKTMTECITIFPEGVGMVPWAVPGSLDLARQTAACMDTFQAVVWTQHGIIASGSQFDATFGLVNMIEKSAQQYLTARAACGGAEPPFMVTDEQLVTMCEAVGVHPNEAFLEEA